jgi:hypothetical protein
MFADSNQFRGDAGQRVGPQFTAQRDAGIGGGRRIIRALNETRMFADSNQFREMRVDAQVRGSPFNETRALAAGGGS